MGQINLRDSFSQQLFQSEISAAHELATMTFLIKETPIKFWLQVIF